MAVYVITSNRDKFLEIEDILEREHIEVLHKNIAVIEHGNTLEQRAKCKARAAFNVIGRPVVADDTGVFFHALVNFPGTYPKKVFDEMGFDGLFQKLEGKDRSASFRAVLCYFDESGPRYFSGEMKGRIDTRIHKSRRDELPYERIFIPDKMFRSVSELTFEEKQLISHRSKAARKLAEFLKTKKD
jgi:XTP/dITP diphosphohydrolase